jgi:microsomal dipeptidase-like Zn-dependent dipeptidase
MLPTRLATLLALTACCSAPTLAQHRVCLQGDERLVILAADGQVEWEMPWGGIHDLHVLANGNVMVQHGSSEVVEIECTTRAVVWNYDAAAKNGNAGKAVEVHSFQPLANGNILIAESGPARILEVDRLGRVQREISLKVDRPDPHTDTRLMRGLPNGNVLVAHEGDGVVREYDGKTSAVVWEYDVPMFGREPVNGHGPDSFGDKCFAAERLANGNTLIATGNGHSVLEVTPEMEVTWSLTQNELEGVSLAWVTTLQVLGNGNYVIGNCHAGPGQPLLVEVDPKTKAVVWRLDRHADFGNNVSNSLVLDDGAEALLRQKAQAIHRAALTLDTHKDISTSLASPDYPEDPKAAARAKLSQDPTVWGTNQVDFPKMRAGGLDVAFYIVYVGQGMLDDEGFARAREIAMSKFDAIERMARRYSDHIEIAHSAADVERIAASGKLVACIGIENGYAMGTDLAAIAEFHARGARYMSLTHNRHSQLGDSNTPADVTLYGGLSDLGRKAIEEMNRVGIMVDVSHAAETTTLQAIAHSKAPVIASHSGVDAIRLHGRNLSDQELLALKANGGVIQCVAFASYVKDDGGRRAFITRSREDLGLPPQRGSQPVDDSPETRKKLKQLRDLVAEFDSKLVKASVIHFVDHIDYAVELIGVDHVAISSDFDGGGGIQGWNHAGETFNVTLELVRRGYSAEQVEKLWSKNTLRVWREVERVAKDLADKKAKAPADRKD